MIVALVVVPLLIISFLAGIYTGNRRVFPFSLLLKLKHALRKTSPTLDAQGSEQFIIGIRDSHELGLKRAELSRYVFGSDSLPLQRIPDEIVPLTGPQYNVFREHGSAEQWIVRMEFGIDSKILFLTPDRVSKRTVVLYHQGHEGSVLHGASIIVRLLNEGFRVAALAMPLLGDNSKPNVEFRRHGTIRLCDHDFFPFLDHEYGCHSVKFFLEPVVATINKLSAAGAQNFAMLGYSGGGWATTMCAALDTRIKASFPVASSLPFSQRVAREMSDYENHIPELYAIANYPELHLLGCDGGRKQLQIFNEYDPVAWSGTRGNAYEPQVMRALSAIGGGRFQVMIDSSWAEHGISRKALSHIISELSTL